MTNMTATARRTLREAGREPASPAAAAPDALPFRAAPHNLEAEQALLGAILVNNEAHDRVSGFLEPYHFFDPLHQQIYETLAALIGTGKQATPITLKTFFESAEPIGSGLSVPAYLGQLAANATTIINVRDYARTVYDLAVRRQLIVIGEDLVNTAYDSPVDFPPKEQIEEARARIDSLSRTAPATLRALTLAELQATELTPQAYVLEGLLREQGLMMLYGWRGIAKTWLALGLAVAMATGGTYLRWKAPRARRVLYIDGEMPAIAMRERLDAMLCDLPVERRGGALQGIRLLSDSLHRDGLPDLASRQGQAAIDRVLGDTEVVVLDNLSTLTRYGDESEADSWRPVQPWLLKLRREGRSVVMVHHAGKGGTQRGTSKREDILDVVLQLRHPADYEPTQGARFEVHYEKARGLIGDQAAPLEASLVMSGGRATWTWQPLADARDAEILEMHEDGTSIRAIAREMRLSKGAVERALKRARAARQG
jgi:hypothetical protein